jgi:hypothetical protein
MSLQALIFEALLACTWKTKMAEACAYDVSHWKNFSCRNTAVVCSQNDIFFVTLVFCHLQDGMVLLSKNV